MTKKSSEPDYFWDDTMLGGNILIHLRVGRAYGGIWIRWVNRLRPIVWSPTRQTLGLELCSQQPHATIAEVFLPACSTSLNTSSSRNTLPSSWKHHCTSHPAHTHTRTHVQGMWVNVFQAGPVIISPKWEIPCWFCSIFPPSDKASFSSSCLQVSMLLLRNSTTLLEGSSQANKAVGEV